MVSRGRTRSARLSMFGEAGHLSRVEVRRATTKSTRDARTSLASFIVAASDGHSKRRIWQSIYGYLAKIRVQQQLTTPREHSSRRRCFEAPAGVSAAAWRPIQVLKFRCSKTNSRLQLEPSRAEPNDTCFAPAAAVFASARQEILRRVEHTHSRHCKHVDWCSRDFLSLVVESSAPES